MAGKTLVTSEHLPWLEEQMAAEGFAVVCQDGSDERSSGVCLVHTIGLCKKGLPEVILEGVAVPRAVELVGNVAAWMVANDLGSADVGKLPVSIPELEIEIFLMWMQPSVGARKAPTAAMVGESPQFVQMCLQDESGRWPWDMAFGGGRDHKASVGDDGGSNASH
jgi:hypothetical protein